MRRRACCRGQSGRVAMALLAGVLTLAACAEIPDVNGIIEGGDVAAAPRIVGAHGPLTPAQSKIVLARLESETHNSDVLSRHLALETALDDSPLVVGNKVGLLRNGAATIQAMFRVIREAKDHVNLEYYTVENIDDGTETLADLLIAKERQGVQINMIYDGFGSLATPAVFFDRLRRAGIALLEFHPLDPLEAKNGYAPNDRDHRKILVADGRRAIIGGVNLSTVYERHPLDPGAGAGAQPSRPWRDTDLEIDGPAAAQLEKLFLATWNAQGGAALSTKPDYFPRIEPKGKEVVRILGSTPEQPIPDYYVSLLSAIRNAESRIWISAAYFVPTHAEMEDLIHAARRGVDVRLLLPGESDSDAALAVGHSHYEDLLEAGVKIYEYRRSVLHSKLVTIDGVWSVVGSSNFDHRSVLFNNEVDAVVLGRDTAGQIEAMFADELARAAPIDRKSWAARPLSDRLNEMLARLWQVLL